MNIIADSHSTSAEWVLTDNETIVEHAFTSGINPFFQGRREASHIVRLELPDIFFKQRPAAVHFYGAGCLTLEKCKIIQSSLVAQFRTQVHVMPDILGAARSVLKNSPGLVCILDNDSNSGQYDGNELIKTVSPLGYILGNEGSGVFMGKRLLADVLKEFAPADIREAFFERFQMSRADLIDTVYTKPIAQRLLAQFVSLLRDNQSHPYVHGLVYRSFMFFFKRNIVLYDYKEQPLHVVGSIGACFQDILRETAADFGVEISQIVKNSIPGLIKYHTENL